MLVSLFGLRYPTPLVEAEKGQSRSNRSGSTDVSAANKVHVRGMYSYDRYTSTVLLKNTQILSIRLFSAYPVNWLKLRTCSIHRIARSTYRKWKSFLDMIV